MSKAKLFGFFFFIVVLIFSGTSSFASNDILIDRGEAAEIIGQPGVVIVDARSEKRYKKRHLPGAVNLDANLIISLRDEASIKKSSAPLPPEKAEKLFGELGISNDSRIVVYDSPPDYSASYVWFALKMYGAENVRILSGGIKAWKKEKRPLTKEAAKITPAVFKAKLRSEILTDADWIIKNKNNVQLVDTRSLEEFIGVRAVGHIPGAIHQEWVDLANAKESFKPAGEMDEAIRKKGISKGKDVVIYCEIGPKATFSFAAFDMLGYNPKFYWGSMRDWQKDPNRPIAKK